MHPYTCPHCGKPIDDDDALLCLYCGESLEREVGFLSRFINPPLKIVLGIIAVIVVISFVLFFFRYL